MSRTTYDSNGNVYGNSIPRYGVTGEGSAAKFIPPNTVRIIWQFSATRVNVFQRRPSTNFVRDFVDAWKKANQREAQWRTQVGLFNSRGLVVGIKTFAKPSSGGSGIFPRIVRIQEAQTVIADAKTRQVSAEQTWLVS